MKIDPNRLFFATILIVAITWVICAAIVTLFPSGMMALTGHMVHANFEGMTWSMTTPGFFIGLVAWSLSAGAVVWLVAKIYNRLPG